MAGSPDLTSSKTPRALWALIAVNFFMADFQSGIGPFLSVFLQQHGWEAGLIGTVLTVGGAAGMAMTAPAGALVDATRHKRQLIAAAAICTCAASTLILVSQGFWVVAASQVATAAASALIGPAIAGVTLGIVHQRGFNRQNGRNQAANHAGNVVAAALSGYLGWRYGFVWIFVGAGLFGVVTLVCVFLIPADAIDDAAARGMKNEDRNAQVSGLRVLLSCKPLLVLAASLFAFHFGNAAMLPMFGLAVVATKQSDPALFVALTMIVAQTVMVAASFVAMRMAEREGYWLVLLVSFLALPVRGLIASQAIAPWGVYPVQILDGVGAGLQSVAVPGLVARILDGTGRVNVGQGAVMTVQNIGASLSPLFGGWIAQIFGYPIMFGALGAIALVSIALWLVFAATLKPACAGSEPTPATG